MRLWKIVGDAGTMTEAEARNRARSMLAALRDGGDAGAPGEALFETVRLQHMRREARAPPGLDEGETGNRKSCASMDRVARQRLAPGDGADRAHQCRHPGPAPDPDPGIARDRRDRARRIRHGLCVANQDLGRVPVRRGQGQPVGEALLGADEQGDGIERWGTNRTMTAAILRARAARGPFRRLEAVSGDRSPTRPSPGPSRQAPGRASGQSR